MLGVRGFEAGLFLFGGEFPFAVGRHGLGEDIDAELVGHFGGFGGGTAVGIFPGVGEGSLVVVGDPAPVFFPTECAGSAVRPERGATWQGIGGLVEGVIVWDDDGGDVGQGLLHEAEEGGVELVASVVGEDHAVIVEEVASDGFGVAWIESEVVAAAHEDDGRRLAFHVVPEFGERGVFGDGGDGHFGAASELFGEVFVRAVAQVEVPVAAFVADADEAEFGSVATGGIAGGTGAFALPDFVFVCGDLFEVEWG